MRFGSVCSGIEAASVAWEPLGWSAAWVAEIDAFPSSVLAHHWPDVPNAGDMLALPEMIADNIITAPDILVGGTPCQAFSVAGRRGSLEDERGALTLAFVEIANEIDRQRDDPCIVVWENVPGVLNTKDNAFGCFLAGLAGETKPLLPSGPRWTNAGCVFGPQRTVAWRILDAQYFGVAQRRRRVFVVASARDGFDPCEVLFEFEGVRRDTAPSREKGQGASADAGSGAAGGCFWDGGQLTQTLDAVLHKGQTMPEKNCFPAVLGIGADGDPMFTLQAGKQHGVACAVTGDIAHTLKAEGHDGSEDGTGRGVPTIAHTVALRGRDGGATAELGGEVATALRASTGGGDKPHVLAFSSKDYGADAMSEMSPTLRAGGHADSHANAGVPPAVAFAEAFRVHGEHSTAMTGSGTARVADPVEVSRCLDSSGGYATNQGGNVVMQSMAVRRLTPRECERLQGFPDDHTLVPHRNKPAADGPRYKALGNSMAVPVMRWIGKRIVDTVSANK